MKLLKTLAIGTAMALAFAVNPASAANVKIALLVKNLGNGFFDAANKGAQEAAKEQFATALEQLMELTGDDGDALKEHYDHLAEALEDSEDRAEEVREYLISQGVPAESVSARGMNFSAPVADNATAAGRSKNRRVEIIISGEIIGSEVSSAFGNQ